MEDPHIWLDASGYYMVVKDMNENITNVYHSGVLAHSQDGINWIVDEKPKAYSRKVKWSNGKTVMQGQLEKPFVFCCDGWHRRF